jgi:hypothetical protein
MTNPSAGSANPSASLSALWEYIQPALDHIIRSPTNDPMKAPVIDVVYHMGIHTATYNYFTAHTEQRQREETQMASHSPEPRIVVGMANRTDLYSQLDRYYAEVARELLLGAPQDDSVLIHYIIPCFNRYAAGAQAVSRLLNYVNRLLGKRALDEDKGWLRLSDVLESMSKTIVAGDTQDSISKQVKEKRTDELKKWGYVDGGSTELMAQAEACAEAASPPDRIVPISSLALRRLRVDFFEPLLAVPKVLKAKAKAMAKAQKPSLENGDKARPKGRLARAVKALLESTDGDEEKRRWLVAELAIALRTVGVRAGHPLRKKLDKYSQVV